MNPTRLDSKCRYITSWILCSWLVFTAMRAHSQGPVAGFSVSQQSGCIPFSVQFNNTSVNSSSWYWDFGNGNFSTSQHPVNIYLGTGSFTVKLVAFNGSGQSDSVVFTNLIQTVSPPAVNFTAANTIACLESGAISFSNLSSGYDSCVWDFGDGITSHDINPVHQYQVAGIYTVTLVAYNSVLGCEASFSKNSYITILANPAVSFTASSTSICNVQQPVQFQASASSATSWHWEFGDGSISNQQQPSHVYSQTGIYSVLLVTTNQLGCTDSVMMWDMISVLDNPIPEILHSDPLIQCKPLVNFFNTTAQTNVSSWSWDFGDTTGSTITNPLHSYYTPGNYVVTLQVAYTNGCVNSDTVYLQVLPNPYAYFQQSNYQGCAPLTVNFNNLSTGQGNTYSWEFGDGLISAQQAPSHNYTAPGNYVVKLTATDVNGCTATFISSNIVQVSQINAAFTADDITGCAPHTVNFTYPGGGVYTYNWNFGDGTTSTLQSPSHTYQNNGSYNVTLTISHNQCTSTYQLPSTVNVTTGVNNFNTVTPVEACAPFTVNLYDNSPATSSWNWDFDDGTTSPLQNPVHTYTSSGTYNVVLNTQSSGTGCSQMVNPYGIYIIHGGEAAFSLNQTVCPPYTATFQDQSVNAVAWFWDFGDGTTSNLQHPVHVYSSPGSYNVSLTITTSDGCTYTEFHNYAVTFLPLVAALTATTADSTLPMLVHFSANSSGATSWFWEFGDGNTSTLQSPDNLYTVPGPYTISLIVSNGSCTDTVVYAGVTFGSGAVLPGSGGDTLHVPDPVYSCVPYEMNFNNPALNTIAWLWEFGDGDTSTLENPVHIYTDPGVYTVTLYTWDSFGNTDTIVQPAPFYLTGSSADFQLSYANNCQGSTIITVNNSVNAVSYLWDFGDGNTSTLTSPTHTYNTIGVNYIVSLTVTDSAGCTDFMARSYYAAGGSSVTASTRRGCAGDTVFFSNGSMNFASYLWDFGDGTSGTGINPWHVYSDSGSYTVSLTVTDSAGCTATYNLPYPVLVNKPVADYSYVLTTGPCQVPSVQFTNLSTGAESYIWDFGLGNYSSQENPVFDFYVNAMYSVSLIASSQGCSDTFTVSNLVYAPYPRPNFSYIQDSECFPVTVTMTDSSHDAVSWLWDFGDGTTSTQQNPVHVFTSDPGPNIRLYITDMYGCVRNISRPNIHAMTMAVSATDSAGCFPLEVALTDSSENVASWLWNFGDGTTDTSANPIHIFQNSGIYNVSLTATAASGCTQTISPVTVIHATGPDAQFSLNTIVSCAPTIVNFNDNSVGALQWNWNFGDNNQSVVENPVHIYNQPGNYDVILIVADENGCTDTLLQQDLVHITGSVANFVVANTTGCSPWNVQFQDASISAFSWLWNFGDGNVSTQQNPVHTYGSPGNYMVTLMTYDTTGCQSVYSYPVPLNVQQPPVALFSLSDTSGCAPFSVTMNNLSGQNLSYTWDFGDGTSSTAMQPGHTFSQPGNYVITLVAENTNGCTDTFASVPVRVRSVPVPSFTALPASGCNPLPVQFINNSISTGSVITYSWNFGNGITSISDEPYFIFQVPGVFDISLTVTSDGVCSASQMQNNLIVVSDGTPPPAVSLKSVSVTGDSTIAVTWGNLTAADLAAYKVYRFNSVLQLFELIYADNNPNNTSFNATTTYTDSVPGTANATYTYIVQAINTCGNELPLDQHVPHTSINLSDSLQNGIVKLSWNYYEGCPVASYEIYRQDNFTGNFNLLATVDASQHVFSDSTVYCEQWVTYRIKATGLCNEGFEAWSDVEVVHASGTLINQRVDIVRSTVMDDSYVFTEWAPPALAPHLVTEFELYRSSDNMNFTLIATLPAGETNYSDFDTKVKSEQYMYRVKVKNLCELQSSDGLPGTSILLEGSIDNENKTLLRWTPYRNWDSGVDYYIIERQDLYGNWQPIKVVDGSTLDYIDR